MDLPFVAKALLRTRTTDGHTVRLPPPAAPTHHLAECKGEIPFASDYGEQTDAVRAEAGLPASEIARLRREGVVA